MFSNSLGIAILLVLCTFTSCTASIKSDHGTTSDVPPTIESQKDIFTKTRDLYPPDQYLIGIGQADSEKAATELARADIMKQIRVEVQVSWTDVLRERSGRTEQEVSRLVETRTAELANGLEIVSQEKDMRTGKQFAVAVLPRTEVARVLRPGLPEPEGRKPLFEDKLHMREGIWVVADGVVSLGEETTVGQAKTRARDEARRNAIEKAVGTFVKGVTVVYNAQVAEELVHSLLRGIIVEEKVLTEGVKQIGESMGLVSLVYATRIKAKVRPIRVEHKGTFTVRTSLNKTVFQDGEEMWISATPSRDAHLYIFSVSQDDAVTVLFPNRFTQNNLINAQQELVFPSEADRSMGLRLRVFSPPGAKRTIEKIKLLAAAKKLDIARGKFQEGVYQVYAGKDNGLVTDLLKELTLLDESEWTESTLPYEVSR